MSKYFYVHVPKTGGTSIDRYFANAFPASHVTHCEHMCNEGRHADISVMHYASGHVPYSMLLRSNICCDKLLASFRDPFLQLSSHLRWLSLIGEDENSVMYKNHPPQFQRVGRTIAALDFGSPQAITDFVTGLKPVERGLFDNYLVRYFCPFPVKGPVRQAHLFAALATLDDFDFLIETETVHEDIEAFFRAEGIPVPADRIHDNSGRSKLTGDAVKARRAELQPLFHFDQTLFHALKERKAVTNAPPKV